MRPLIVILAVLLLAACGRTASELFEQGASSHKRGDPQTAIVHLKNAVQKAPDDANVRFYLAGVYNEVFDGVSAEKELTKAAQLGLEADGRVMAALARALWLQGNHTALTARAEPLPKFDASARAEILAFRGHAFTALGQIESARESLRQAREAAAGKPLAIIDLLQANILTSEREAVGALAIIERVLHAQPRLYDALALKADVVRVTGTAEAAIAAYTDLLKVHPTHLIALVGRSTLAIRLERFDAAEKDIQVLRSAHKDHFITAFQAGLLRFRKGQFRTALEAFQRSLKLNQSHEEARLFEGMSQFYLGNAQSAQRSLNQYLTDRPGDLLGRRMLAMALVQLNESARALEVIALVLESGESRPEFWEIAGEAYARIGDLEKAAYWLGKLEQARPEDASIQQKQADLNMQRGRTDLAQANYAEAARLNKKLSGADTMLVLLNLRVRDFDRAFEAVKKMEQKAPEDPFVANMKGVVLLEQGKAADAAAVFEVVLKKHPAFLPAAANLARLDLREGKADRAKARFEGVLAADKNHMQALLLLAGFEQRLGKPKEAIALLERAAQAHPRSLEPRLRLVDLLLEQGNLQLAQTRAEEAVAQNPTSAVALEALARVKLREGDKHSAVRAFARIVDLQPKSAAAHVARAQAERAAGMTKDAEATLRKALELQKSYPPAQAALFELLLQQNRVAHAADFAKQLKSELPKSPLGHVFEAEVLVFQKKFKEAVAPYQTALALGRTGDLAARLYEVRALAGESKTALVELRRWVEDHPKDAAARIRLAAALLDQADYAGAVKEYQIIVQSAPANALFVNNLAWAYYKAGDARRALHFAQGAKQLNPQDPFINDTLGWLLLEKGEVSQARQLLAAAASQLKDRPDVRYHYAAALLKSGDKQRALEELKAALALDKGFSERDEALALLEKLKP